MGKSKVPSGDAPDYERVQPERVWYGLWIVPQFPLRVLGGKLDKDVSAAPWLLGLKDDIAKTRYLRNPVIVWNHHPLRGKKQPYWLLRAGSNRLWCVEQLGWTHVPAVVSTATPEDAAWIDSIGGDPVHPSMLEGYFPDGGNIWANEHGFGLLRAKKPEVTYAAYVPTNSELADVKPTSHGVIKLHNPMLDD